MLFINLTDSLLSWEMAGNHYLAEPKATVEIPDNLVSLVESRGLMLSRAPEPPYSIDSDGKVQTRKPRRR